MNDLHLFMFWASVVLIVVAVAMGIAGLWVPSSDTGRKLFATNLVLLAGTLVLAVVSKWLR